MSNVTAHMVTSREVNPRISFIIPAFNEESLLGSTIQALHDAMDGIGDAYEIIVVNDASTDRTREIALLSRARVIDVNKRQIGAVRNVGAREARGDLFIFVDADTFVPESTIRGALAELSGGAVGGGCAVEIADHIPCWGWLYIKAFLMVWKPLKLAAGCFLFVRRESFEAVGGFDERYFASEEIWLSKALKQQGRFVILRECAYTSGRKARMYRFGEVMRLSIELLLKGPRAWQSRTGLDMWYDGRREEPISKNRG